MVAALVAGLVAATMVVAGCTVPSTWPDGTVPQVPPIGLNGMAEVPGASASEVWAADYFGHQLLRFDVATGEILERHGGLCDTDDVVVAPDGSLVATCPGDGTVVRLPAGGAPLEVLATVGNGVNPIALEPGGEAVVVGFGTAEHDTLLSVPLDGGPVQTVASGLPVLNGFGFGPDGLLYAPTGGVGGVFGGGGLISIDVSTGAVHQIPLQFDDPAKRGLDFAVGVEVGPDGTVYVAQGFTPAVYAVDPSSGHATLVGASPLPMADNLVVLSDGRIVLSGFFGNGYVTFSPDAHGGWTGELSHVGS